MNDPLFDAAVDAMVDGALDGRWLTRREWSRLRLRPSAREVSRSLGFPEVRRAAYEIAPIADREGRRVDANGWITDRWGNCYAAAQREWLLTLADGLVADVVNGRLSGLGPGAREWLSVLRGDIEAVEPVDDVPTLCDLDALGHAVAAVVDGTAPL